ncbi:MAG: FAD-dependent oxidoreductase [Bacteriovoracaceae bacterium]
MTSVAETEVLIIGSGVAGLTSAIKLAEKGTNVIVVTREKDPNITNTFYAQGGIIFPPEDTSNLFNDIMKASANTAFTKATEVLTSKSRRIFQEILLDKAHTEFNRDKNGNLLYTKEAAHSDNIIVYNGDYTGKTIQVSLLNYLKDKKRFPNVTILTGHTAIDLITPNHHGLLIPQRYEENSVLGAYCFNQYTNEVIKIMSKVTILATGGIGALYLHHSNARGARGDGHACAKRAGASLINMEFVQFHPTTLYDRYSHKRFLISEAVRGEGGVLLNANGNAFMEKYHPDKELAPRDIVTRAIHSEMIETKSDYVFLDISKRNSDWLRDRFPTIYRHCFEHHIDITKVPIPVVPAAHYTCGGVKCDEFGQTSLKNLYAVGEVACTGLHGANRLASTSLLEGLTWGYLAAEKILEDVKSLPIYDHKDIRNWEKASDEFDLSLIAQDWSTIKQSMWNYLGIIRSTSRLNRAQTIFNGLSEGIGKFYRNSKLHDELIGLRNAVDVAQSVLSASIINKNSVGCFYRKD